MCLPKVGLCTKPKQGNSIEHLNENQLYRPESPTFGKPRNVSGKAIETLKKNKT